VAYADDVAIIFNGKYPQTLCDLMSAKLKILSEWTIANGLGLSPSKTELVLFTNRYKVPQLNPRILNNCNLSFSDHARYLGLVLDKLLKWGLNNQERTKKATIALYCCKKAIGLGWGMSPRIAHIQQAGQIAINLLKKIFQSILAVGELPTAWQETKVVFIPKAGKATHTSAKDFRPVSLASFLLKSFERMTSLHIRATVDPTQISEAQHAYTKGK